MPQGRQRDNPDVSNFIRSFHVLSFHAIREHRDIHAGRDKPDRQRHFRAILPRPPADPPISNDLGTQKETIQDNPPPALSIEPKEREVQSTIMSREEIDAIIKRIKKTIIEKLSLPADDSAHLRAVVEGGTKSRKQRIKTVKRTKGERKTVKRCHAPRKMRATDIDALLINSQGVRRSNRIRGIQRGKNRKLKVKAVKRKGISRIRKRRIVKQSIKRGEKVPLLEHPKDSAARIRMYEKAFIVSHK